MADILEKINKQHGKELWEEVNTHPQLADFHRKNYISKYNWDDVYDVIAYERSRGMESFISAMMAMNLIKGKLRASYFMSGDVFVGNVDDRLQDIYEELYLMLLKKIPAWDMSRGVYLDTYLWRDIDSCVRKTSDFAVYGTGTGSNGPGVAASLSTIPYDAPARNGQHGIEISNQKDNSFYYDNGLLNNLNGECFETVEKRLDIAGYESLLTQENILQNIDENILQAATFVQKFDIPVSAHMKQNALEAMMYKLKNDINITDTIEIEPAG